MPLTNDIRRTLNDPTPLYFAAGLIDKIREEAPERIATVRATDPKEVQARVAQQAKETQAKVSERLTSLDMDIKRLREQAQHLALQGVGVAAEYAVKARETYDELADRGRGAVQGRRGSDPDDPAVVTVEREPVKVAKPPKEEPAAPANGKPAGTAASDVSDASAASTGSAGKAGPEAGPEAKAEARPAPESDS